MSGAFRRKHCWIARIDMRRQGTYRARYPVTRRLDIAGMMARKEKIVSQLTGGVSGLLKANGVTVITGAATLSAGRQVDVVSADGESQSYTAEHVVLAAGSEPAAIPPAPVDGDRVVDSTGALCFEAVPERLGVVARVLASSWAASGRGWVLR